MTDNLRQLLDALDDELFLAWLSINYGTKIPKWEECSQEEYVKHCGSYGIDHDKYTLKDLEMVISGLCSNETYKVEPIYNDFHGGILNWTILQGRKPDAYKFYKKVGEEFVIMLGADLLEYCQTRDIMKQCFKPKENEKDNVQR